jgi:hypothetical protein
MATPQQITNQVVRLINSRKYKQYGGNIQCHLGDAYEHRKAYPQATASLFVSSGTNYKPWSVRVLFRADGLGNAVVQVAIPTDMMKVDPPSISDFYTEDDVLHNVLDVEMYASAVQEATAPYQMAFDIVEILRKENISMTFE